MQRSSPPMTTFGAVLLGAKRLILSTSSLLKNELFTRSFNVLISICSRSDSVSFIHLLPLSDRIRSFSATF